MKKKTAMIVAILCFGFTSLGAHENVRLGLSAEIPQGRNYILRAELQKLVLLGQIGLDIQSSDAITNFLLRIGGGTAFTFYQSEKFNSFAGGKLIININDISSDLSSQSHTSTSVTLLPLIGVGYKLIPNLQLCYEFQYELTFGSFISGTRGQAYITYWITGLTD